VNPQSDDPRKKKRTLILAALAIIFVLAVAAVLYSLTEWNAPASARRLQNPLPANPSAVHEGMFLYQKHCKSCHGEDGDGNGNRASELSVMPTNFTNAPEMNRLTDGELFWKITHGHRPMPAFEDKLNETERWQVVDYIRAFARPSAPPQPKR
jgi:mono/diheme cytochrome c family protein